MDQDDAVVRFRRLSERYDELHRPDTWLRLEDEFGLGSGPFNDRLTIKDIRDLNRTMEKRLTQSC